MLGVGSGVGLCITVLLVVGLWVRHAKCGQRSEVMMMMYDVVECIMLYHAEQDQVNDFD